MDTKKKHYYGCIPSKMDGSEHVVDVDMKVKLPDEFDLRNVMPPVRDQGATQTCVCQTLTGVLDFLHNSNVGTDGKCNNFSINTLYNSRSNKPFFSMKFLIQKFLGMSDEDLALNEKYKEGEIIERLEQAKTLKQHK